MSLDPDNRRLVWQVLVFIVVCIVLGGLWPWLIR